MPVSSGPSAKSVLVQFEASQVSDQVLLRTIVEAVAGVPSSIAETRILKSLRGQSVAIYFDSETQDEPASRLLSKLAPTLSAIAIGSIEVTRLRSCLLIAGASAGETTDYHYVVRTDVIDGAEGELERWYDSEHMPSLAAVPGAVFAQRLRALDTAPAYYACYDLTTPDVLETAPWQAARATEWSNRVRPTFRHTRRTMFRSLTGEQ